MLLLLLIILATLTLLVTQRVRIEITALAVIAVLCLTGMVSAEEALSGFSNQATLTVAAMLILSSGLERAGVVDYLGTVLARRASGSNTMLLVLVAIPTALLSAFMNNTAIVALMIPVALTLSRKRQAAPSKLLLPISYFAILGGTCTLVGTSTNILVDSLYRQAGGPGFRMFEFSALGIVFLLTGGSYVLLMSRRLLPNRAALSQLVDDGGAHQFITEVTVPDGSGLVDRRIGDVFGADKDVKVLELIRGEEATLGPDPDLALEVGDVLLIEGTARTIHDMISRRRVEQGTAVFDDERVPINRLDLHMVEALVGPNSHLLHRQVRDLGLSRRHGIQVLAVRRLGRHHQYNLRALRLRPGDVLLLQGEREALRGLQNEGQVLLIEGVEKTLTFTRKAPLAIAILVAVVGLAALEVAPMVVLAIAGVVAMLATGCLSVPRATRALEPGVLLLLAGMIPMGLAMDKTGLAAAIGNILVTYAGSYGPHVLIAAVYLSTSMLTEVLSNNATAVLVTPICLGIAATTGIDPKPLLMAVTFGASASFATPIGYQTNTMVMGPGGYVFKDYLRFGLPLNLLLWMVASLVIPRLWPP